MMAMESKVITQKGFKTPSTHCSAGYQMVIKKTTGQLKCQVTTNFGNETYEHRSSDFWAQKGYQTQSVPSATLSLEA